jgi:uncharacterized protein YkwD
MKRRRRNNPVRTGLLATSAAMAVGAIAVSAGLLPSPNGSGGFSFTGSGTGTVQAGSQSENTGVQGGESPAPTDRASTPASRGDSRPSAPVITPSASASATPSTPTTVPSPSSSITATVVPSPSVSSSASAPADTGATVEEQVLALVNVERAKIGCVALTADPALTTLAQNFSDDMAKRNFFDHVDPDGNDPWDRAEAAGITGLGGENIARGQADAQAVMDAWMNSDGHRANILNCNFRTLGVGASFADGGPWWTQDFGY